MLDECLSDSNQCQEQLIQISHHVIPLNHEEIANSMMVVKIGGVSEIPKRKRVGVYQPIIMPEGLLVKINASVISQRQKQ